MLLGAALPVLLLTYGALVLFGRPSTPGTELRLDEYLFSVRDGGVRDATILDRDGRVVGTYTEGQYWVAIPDNEITSATVFGALLDAGIPTTNDPQWTKGLIGPFTTLLPALIFVDAFFLIFLLMRQGGALMAFGRARTTRGTRESSFADVAGLEEAVEELTDVKDYLEDPKSFVRMGARVPRGILLAGPPGCGKTLLARALAGEAGVPFYSISGSDFVEIFVGVGASRIRDLFRLAKEHPPAIVFIDELDAVGRGRQAVALGGQDEREATLNQLLVEMDGFDPTKGVVVVAATNRPDILDSALLRPGRFDRRVMVDRPDLRGRRAILQIHCAGKPLDPEVDLDALARRTPGFSGADLANVVNEAAILATRAGGSMIEMRHFVEGVERAVAGGPERRSRIIGEREREIIATHEAGHAVAAAALEQSDAPSKVSIVARGGALGFTFVEPEEDRFLVTRPQLTARLAMLLAGRVAEQMSFGEPSTSAQDDLLQASRIAESMVRSYGMSEGLGPFVLGTDGDDHGGLITLRYSEELAAEADREVRRLLGDAEVTARAILSANRVHVSELAARLRADETVEGEELKTVLARVRAPNADPVELRPRTEGRAASESLGGAMPREGAESG